jgi:hypothetical protein
VIEAVFELMALAFWHFVAGPVVSAVGASILCFRDLNKSWGEHFIALYKSFPTVYGEQSESRKSWILGFFGVFIAISTWLLIGWIARSF